MATKRFRLERLSPEDQRVFQQLEERYPGLQDYVEKNGKMPDDIFSKLNISTGKKQTLIDKYIREGGNKTYTSDADLLNSVVAKLPSAQAGYQGYLDSQKNLDEANLSDEDLQNRLTAYTELSKINNPAGPITKPDALKSNVNAFVHSNPAFKQYDVASKNVIAGIIADRLISKGGFQESDFPGLNPDALKAVQGSLNDPKFLSQFRDNVPLSSGEDISRVQGILSDRGFVRDQESQVAGLEESIPKLLASQREAYYGGERSKVKDYITGQEAPQIIEQLNRRHLADSGEVVATISSRYADILGTIDNAEIDQMNEEANYWADQKYQNTFDQLIAARTGVASTIDETRGKALTTSAQNFSKSQQKIQDQFNLDLFKSQNERALSNYQKQIQDKNNKSKADKDAQLGSDAASTATTLIALAALG